jgi:hypothetical protein
MSRRSGDLAPHLFGRLDLRASACSTRSALGIGPGGRDDHVGRHAGAHDLKMQVKYLVVTQAESSQ